MPLVFIGLLVLMGVVGHEELDWIHLPITLAGLLSMYIGVRMMEKE